MKKLQPINQQIIMLTQGNRGPPFFPAIQMTTGIKHRTQETDYDCLSIGHIPNSSILSQNINFRIISAIHAFYFHDLLIMQTHITRTLTIKIYSV